MPARDSVSRSLLSYVVVACLALGACRSAESPTRVPSPPAVPSPMVTALPKSTLPPAATPTSTPSATPSPAPTATPSPIPTPRLAPIRGNKSSTILIAHESDPTERGDLDTQLLFEDLPSFVLYADGRMLFSPPRFNHLTWYDEVRLTPSQVCDWMDRIYATGIMESPGFIYTEPWDPMVIPASRQVLTIRGVPSKTIEFVSGREHALIPEVTSMLALVNISRPDGTRQSPKERVILRIQEPEGRIELPPGLWPATLPTLEGAPIPDKIGRILELDGSAAATIGRAMALPGIAYFTDKGRIFRVVGRPLLPHETAESWGNNASSGTDYPACAVRQGAPRPTSTISPDESRRRYAHALEYSEYDAIVAGIPLAQPAQADWHDWHILDGQVGLDLGSAYVFSSAASSDRLIDFCAFEGVRVGLSFRGMITSEARVNYPPEILVWSRGVHVLVFRPVDPSATQTWTIVRVDSRSEVNLVVIANPTLNYWPRGVVGPGPWPSVIDVDSTLAAARLPAPGAPPLENWRGWSIRDGLAGTEFDQGYLFSSKASCADLEAFYSGTGAPAELGEGLPFAEFADADADAVCKRTLITYRASEGNRRDYRVYIFMGDDGARVLIRETN